MRVSRHRERTRYLKEEGWGRDRVIEKEAEGWMDARAAWENRQSVSSLRWKSEWVSEEDRWKGENQLHQQEMVSEEGREVQEGVGERMNSQERRVSFEAMNTEIYILWCCWKEGTWEGGGCGRSWMVWWWWGERKEGGSGEDLRRVSHREEWRREGEGEEVWGMEIALEDQVLK